MNTKQLERDIRAALRRLESLDGEQTGQTPNEEVADLMASAIVSMRQVILDGAKVADILAYTPSLQALLVAEPSGTFTDGMQVGDYQDLITAWQAFEVFLEQSLTVGERTVTTREIIQRREPVYSAPEIVEEPII